MNYRPLIHKPSRQARRLLQTSSSKVRPVPVRKPSSVLLVLATSRRTRVVNPDHCRKGANRITKRNTGIWDKALETPFPGWKSFDYGWYFGFSTEISLPEKLSATTDRLSGGHEIGKSEEDLEGDVDRDRVDEGSFYGGSRKGAGIRFEDKEGAVAGLQFVGIRGGLVERCEDRSRGCRKGWCEDHGREYRRRAGKDGSRTEGSGLRQTGLAEADRGAVVGTDAIVGVWTDSAGRYGSSRGPTEDGTKIGREVL